jgi:hypothetical protein
MIQFRKQVVEIIFFEEQENCSNHGKDILHKSIFE